MSIAAKCTCGASLYYCNGSAECTKANLMFQAAHELDRAAKRIEEYEQFIEWLNKKPEYKHIYQQYLSKKYP